MHPEIFDAFETVCAPLDVTGGVLEIGVSPDHRSLLDLPCLARASERVGVGLEAAFAGPEGRYRVLKMDANDLHAFADGAFQLVLCNSMLEHDRKFWLTLGEARRVTAPGGWLVLGVPSYGVMGDAPGRRFMGFLAAAPGLGRRFRAASDALRASSLTLGLHNFPADYFRFSERAMADILLEGLEQIETRSMLRPPRVIGVGRKPPGRDEA
jgi:SAM-dependent methyltransferase